MPHGPRVLRASIAAAAVTVVAACGSSASSSSSAGAARQATLAAFDKSTAESLRFSEQATFTFDTSKLRNIPSDLMQAITSVIGNGLTLSGTGAQESASRSRMTVTLKPLVTTPMTIVLYDGTFYYSLDGGRTFGSGGSLSSLTGGFSLSTDSEAKIFASLPQGAFTDKGQTQVDGTTVEHYSAQLTKDQILGAIAGQPSPGSQAQKNLQQITQFLVSGSSTMDVDVRTDNGQLARYVADVNFGLDLGAIAGGLSGGATTGSGEPSGVVQVHVGVTNDYFDYGTPITIQKPRVDPNAPRLPSGVSGLGGLL